MAHEPDQELIDAFRVLRIELRVANDRIAAAADIKPRDLDILDVIDREGSCTPSHLAARTGLRAATLTGVLARLESCRWITRSTDPRDARSSWVTSTERFEQVRSLYQHAGGPVQRVFDQIGPDNRDTVMWFLRALAAALHEAGSDIAGESQPNGMAPATNGT
ncbi:DNA-binding MarR family transcriptional regulator [Nocardia transvalensis]|uniref:DNA-binding MarR family transcriptional regulator n=1 Tax=Nocardia transvalensis TaxID=37333 RepID=A0A7W9UN01_9NOCA|nr:MarR family transcriptional regulator [Nocardia transvalensis]MBB5918315.1 DNA-binding MarR family transcriptional regulator [Nocardia transvalensis]